MAQPLVCSHMYSYVESPPNEEGENVVNDLPNGFSRPLIINAYMLPGASEREGLHLIPVFWIRTDTPFGV